jgi:polysaccharide pyruvyl transferase WcaK-like protein
LKFVILNDTREQPHFGCQRVMRTISHLLESRGATIIATALSGVHWDRDPHFLSALRDCDAILINGEGTLHHGQARAERLLQVVDHPLRAGKPVSIVNALYQANPPEWSRYLNKVQMIVARDGKSYNELVRFYGGNLVKALDLSLHESPPAKTATKRNVITFGDSVYPEVTRRLIGLSESIEGACFLPIMRTIKSRKVGLPLYLRILRDIYIRLHAMAFQAKHKNVRFAKNEFEFLDLVAHARIHVTGRFHGACLSLLVGTPFIATTSNSWKVEALIDDLGLSRERVIGSGRLERDLIDINLAFSHEELRNITIALEESRRMVEHAFDRIAAESTQTP